MSGLVTFGIPTYNSERTIGPTIESVLSLSLDDCIIHVADNHSTDATCAIVEKYRDTGKVLLTRHKENKGPGHNFRYLVETCQTKYFMWIGSDDQIQGNMAPVLRKMEEGECFAMAFKSSFLFDEPVRVIEDKSNGPLVGSPSRKRAKFLLSPGANSRFYSLYETDTIRNLFIEQDWSYWGADVFFTYKLLARGQWDYWEGVTLLRRPGSSSNPLGLRRSLGMRGIGLFLPYPKFIIEMYKITPSKYRPMVAPLLSLYYLRLVISPFKHYLTQQLRRSHS